MNKTLKIGTLALLLASVGIVGAANAFGGGSRGGSGEMPTFEEMDTNGDGVVTAEELAAVGEARFAEMDADGDGVLSVEEITAMITAEASARAAKGVERMLERLDENGDGVISQDEMPERDHSRVVDHLDEDDDGAISEEEFETAKEMRKGKGGKRGKGGDGKGDRH